IGPGPGMARAYPWLCETARHMTRAQRWTLLAAIVASGIVFLDFRLAALVSAALMIAGSAVSAVGIRPGAGRASAGDPPGTSAGSASGIPQTPP
ncbi:MAG: hypothetical protein M3Q66_00610, partial [Chloroflexota bacterium]|nr:hypothetical protein [Chloroflexota bacterium]